MKTAALVLLALAGQETPLAISYDAPAECPSEAAFFEALRARTDRFRRAGAGETALEVGVHVSHGDHGFHGELREADSAARTVDGETCAEVIEALSLTVALSVDPEARAPVPPTPTPVAPPIVIVRRVYVQAPVPRTVETRLELGVGAAATEVLASDFSLGGALSATLLRDTSASTSASVQLSLLWATTGALTSPATHRARLSALLLDACPVRFKVRSLELAPCLLGSAGVLEATGRDLAETATVDRTWWSAGVDAQVSVALGAGFQVEGALGGSLPFWRRRFYTTEPQQVVTETPVVSPLARLGLGFRF